ncbi:hypothetical protein Tco_1262055 [Tanacetum coccineum]
MAQQQHAADVHPDELCPPNKRYDLMDANKKVDLEHVQCPPESKILTNIIKNHPLRFSIAASSSVPWIYMAQFWHTLKEDGSKYRLKFMLDKKELTLTLDDFQTKLYSPQATKKTASLTNHKCICATTIIFLHGSILQASIGIYNGVKDTIEFQDYWSSAAMANVMQNILQMLNNTCHWMGPTAVADNANVVLLCQQHSCGLCGVTMGRTLLFASSSNIFDSVSKIYKDHLNVTDEDEEITNEVYELKRREIGKYVEETRNSPIPTPIRSLKIHTNHVSSDTEKLKELTDNPHTTSSSSSPHKKLAKTNRLLSLFKTKPTRFKRYKSFFHELQGRYGYLFAHLRARFMPRKSFDTLADNLHDVMVETLPAMVDKHIKEQVMKQNAIANVIPSQVDASVRNYMSGHILHVHPAQSQTSFVPEQQYQLYLAMKANPQLQQQDIAIWLALQMKFERNTVLQTALQSGRRPQSMKLMYLESHHLDKFFKRNKLHQLQEFGHEHKFITEIVARRANGCIVSITEPDYKNLNKNDIEDIYLLIMNGKVPDYADTGLLWSLSVFIRSLVIWERVHDFQLGVESYQQKVNLTAPTITFPRIKEHDMFSIIYEPVHGIIYKNSKKEKLVMRHTEIHKFCDATLNRVLEGLKSYNNDVKYGYVQKDLTKDETKYLKLFEEEIEERLKHRRQMRI